MGFFNGSLRHKSDWGWPGSSASYQTANGANGYGLHDMAGNVFEWCNDWYGSSYYQEYLNQGSPPDPRGPISGSYRTSRGGCWDFYGAYWCRVAARDADTSDDRSKVRGFRCASGTP